MSEENACQCCGKAPSIGVACSSMGAFSIAWCRSCLDAGIEPYWACVATAVSCGGTWEGLAEWAQETITRSLAAHGKTREEFDAEVAKDLADEAAYFASETHA